MSGTIELSNEGPTGPTGITGPRGPLAGLVKSGVILANETSWRVQNDELNIIDTNNFLFGTFRGKRNNATVLTSGRQFNVPYSVCMLVNNDTAMANYYYMTESTSANTVTHMDSSGSQFMIIPPPTDVSSIEMVMTFRVYNIPEQNAHVIEANGGYFSDVSSNLSSSYLQKWSCYIIHNAKNNNNITSLSIVAAPAVTPPADISVNILTSTTNNWLGQTTFDVYSIGVGPTGQVGPTGPAFTSTWTQVPSTTNIYYASGSVGIGTATPDTNYILDVSGTIKTLGVNNVSDYRIKENVMSLSMSSNIPNLDGLRPVMYYNKLLRKNEYGFIAHEVQEIFPDIVVGNKDAEQYQTINYMSMVPLIVKEIKEMKREISELKEKLRVHGIE